MTKLIVDRYESGSHSAKVDIYYLDKYPLHLIGPIEIIWKSSLNDSRRIWLRIHPSIYNEVWDAIKDGMNKLSNPQITMLDLRGDIESFEITGPRAGKVLKRILRVCRSENGVKKNVS